MKKVIIYGACSAIATATAKLYAEENVDLFFIAQNEEKVKSLVEDFSVRYEKSPKYAIHNALNTESLAEVFSDAVKELGGLDIILIAHGILPDQEKAEKDLEYLHKVSMINGNSAVYLSQIAANYFVEKSKGTIAVISSVAGDRGRYSNYIYGASKGYISVFLQGLKNKMAHHGVNVLNIKPGFVDTPMTAHLPKNFLFAAPEEVAKDIYKGIKKGKSIIYSKGIWKMVMMIVIHVPCLIFNKMKM